MENSHPEDVSRWGYMSAGLGARESEVDKWTCTIGGFTAAMLAAGIVGWLISSSWLPIWFRAVLCIGVFGAVIFASQKACAQREAAAEDEAEAAVTETPVAATPPAPEPAPATGSPAKPVGLDGPRGGAPDDLTVLRGVGPALAKLCNDLGYYHYDQIAAWNDDEVAWVDANLEGFKGRVTRDEWVAQAKELVAAKA
ncbi:MAG: NADH:ubiquinone oxidoreductase [Pseudomonadota bacterium]